MSKRICGSVHGYFWGEKVEQFEKRVFYVFDHYDELWGGYGHHYVPAVLDEDQTGQRSRQLTWGSRS